jgi:hypothetical protein
MHEKSGYGGRFDCAYQGGRRSARRCWLVGGSRIPSLRSWWGGAGSLGEPACAAVLTYKTAVTDACAIGGLLLLSFASSFTAWAVAVRPRTSHTKQHGPHAHAQYYCASRRVRHIHMHMHIASERDEMLLNRQSCQLPLALECCVRRVATARALSFIYF